jgi:hypothetical protein
MEMNIIGRLQRLERLRAERPRRRITITTADPGWRVPGTIEPWGERGFTLYVDPDYASDPVLGLDREQREFLASGDEVSVLIECEVEDGSLKVGDPIFTWRPDLIELPWDEVHADSLPGFARQANEHLPADDGFAELDAAWSVRDRVPGSQPTRQSMGEAPGEEVWT